MPDLSNLASLGPDPRDPEDGLATPGERRPSTSRQPQRITPHPRGVIAPAIGHVSSHVILRALMASGDGWLNTDGRIVSNGTYTSHEALGTVPEMAAAFARIQEVDDAIVRRVRAIHKTARASHIASGEPMEDFHFDANLHDDHEPQAATDKAIDDGGWAGIALRLVDGVREVILTRYGASSGPFTQALASLEEGLGFTTPSQPVHGQALPGDLTDSSQGCDPVFGPR